MRKKLENSPTKQRILDQAQSLMIAKGFSGTSVDEVCAKAKVTKGNFFYYFKSKENLGQELISRFTAEKHKQTCCAMDQGNSDPLQRIYSSLDLMEEWAAHPDFKGCLVGTFSQEANAIGSKLKSMCCENFERGAEFYAREFAQAIKKYPPKQAVTPKALAQFFLSGVQGSFVLMKATGDVGLVRSNIKLMRSFIESVFGK